MCNIVSFIIPPYSNFIEKIHQSYILHTGNIKLTPLEIAKILEKVINRLYFSIERIFFFFSIDVDCFVNFTNFQTVTIFEM